MTQVTVVTPVHNTQDYLHRCIGSVLGQKGVTLRHVIIDDGSTDNSAAIARHYAMLAEYGELDGVRILSSERVDIIRALQTGATDELFQDRARKGLGYFLGGPEEEGGSVVNGPNPGAFGHGGNGGSHGFADPERRLAFGLTKNLMRSGAAPRETVAFKVADTIRTRLG